MLRSVNLVKLNDVSGRTFYHETLSESTTNQRRVHISEEGKHLHGGRSLKLRLTLIYIHELWSKYCTIT